MLTTFIFKTIIASGVLFLYYQVALKNKKFHSYNRFYLLLSVVMSLMVPFINLRWFYIEASPSIPLNNFVTTITSPVERRSVQFFTTSSVLFIISAFISCLFLIFLTEKITWIYRLKRMNEGIKMNGFTLIETDVKQAPFSFLSNLFWRRGLSSTDTNGEKIFKHELTHIRQKHTYDKLFTQIVCCMFWINPFYWLIQRELNTIHEFIADAASVADGDTESFAKMLLHSHNQGSYLSPSHPFFNSSIKRRLIMISTSNKSQYSYMRRALALPLTLLVLAAFSINVKAQSDKNTSQQSTKENLRSSVDTVPKASAKQSLEPKTVIGHKLENQPVQKTDDIIVTGHSGRKSENKPVQNPSDIIVIGHSGRKSENQPVQKTDDIIVTGHSSRKSENQPVQKTDDIIVIGHKIGSESTKKPAQSLEPVTVGGHKSEEKTRQDPMIISGQKLVNKPEQEPMTVTGQKLQKPSQQPIIVTGHKLVKKTE